jgi:DNA-binding transcriptional LysR family regulator
MIIPNENLSLRRMLDKLWQANMTGQVRGIAEVNNTRTMKALVQDGIGIGWLTEFDVMKELKEGSLVFVPVAGEGLELEPVADHRGGRSMSVPASCSVACFERHGAVGRADRLIGCPMPPALNAWCLRG